MTSHIKIIQNILKKKDRYDLALKIENCYFEDYQIDNNVGEIKLFVHPNNFLDFKKLNKEDLLLFIELLSALPDNYSEIESVVFAIGTKRVIENVSYAV